MTTYKQALDRIAEFRALVSEHRAGCNARWAVEFEAECEKRHPKAAKKARRAKKALHWFLSEAEISAIVAEMEKREWVVEGRDRDSDLSDEIEVWSEQLPTLAQEVCVASSETVWSRVKVSCTSSFNSQTQPEFYAREQLVPLEKKLRAAGVRCEVKTIKGVVTEFELWAACEPWEAEALEMQMTLVERLAVHDRCCNVRVLYPSLTMLPWATTEKLLVQAGRVC